MLSHLKLCCSMLATDIFYYLPRLYREVQVAPKSVECWKLGTCACMCFVIEEDVLANRCREERHFSLTELRELHWALVSLACQLPLCRKCSAAAAIAHCPEWL